jgi:hypothetical protein
VNTSNCSQQNMKLLKLFSHNVLFFSLILQFTSSIFLTVLSADRYIAVCHPISAPKFRTPVIARCVSLSAWAVSALLMMPVFMYAATLSKPDGTTTCNIFWPSDDHHHRHAGNGTLIDEDYVPPVIF